MKNFFGLLLLLSVGLCAAAQEQATQTSGVQLALLRTDASRGTESSAAEPAIAATRAVRSVIRLTLSRPEPATPAAELRLLQHARRWSSVEAPFDGLRQQFQIEKVRNFFLRETKLQLAGAGPVQLAAFESHQRCAAFHPVTQYAAGRTGDGAIRLMNLARPTTRSYGLTLALRWN